MFKQDLDFLKTDAGTYELLSRINFPLKLNLDNKLQVYHHDQCVHFSHFKGLFGVQWLLANIFQMLYFAYKYSVNTERIQSP